MSQDGIERDPALRKRVMENMLEMVKGVDKLELKEFTLLITDLALCHAETAGNLMSMLTKVIDFSKDEQEIMKEVVRLEYDRALKEGGEKMDQLVRIIQLFRGTSTN